MTRVSAYVTDFDSKLLPVGSIVPYVGSSPPTTDVIAGTATFTFGDTEFDDVNNGTLALISLDGTSRTYTIKNDYGAATNIEFNAGASASVAAANLKAAIEHADGHDGKITVFQNEGQLTLTQATLGDAGNTLITSAASFDNACDVNPPASFTAGRTNGWLLCDGAAMSRALYTTLFSLIGTTHGTGDGSTTFNLPDLRGRFLVGRDNMGPSAAPDRIVTGAQGVDGDTLGASGGKVCVADAGISEAFIVNWLIRAHEDDS